MLSCEMGPNPAIRPDHVPPLQREVRVREWEGLGSHCVCFVSYGCEGGVGRDPNKDDSKGQSVDIYHYYISSI